MHVFIKVVPQADGFVVAIQFHHVTIHHVKTVVQQRGIRLRLVAPETRAPYPRPAGGGMDRPDYFSGPALKNKNGARKTNKGGNLTGSFIFLKILKELSSPALSRAYRKTGKNNTSVIIVGAIL